MPSTGGVKIGSSYDEAELEKLMQKLRLPNLS